MTEPKRLVRELAGLGLTMINITIATPYLKPHISRPYDQPGRNGYPQPEHPIIGIARILNVVKEMQKAVPDCVIVGTGFSWLRQFAPYVAAGMVRRLGLCLWVWTGGFAYPILPMIFSPPEMSPGKCASAAASVRTKGPPDDRMRGQGFKVYAPSIKNSSRRRQENRK